MRHATFAMILLALLTAALVLWPGEGAILGKRIVRFTVWGMPFEDRLFEDLYARRYEAINPDIIIDYGRFADIRMKYNAWHARRQGPEVMRIELTWYEDFARRGLIEPLTSYINDPSRGLSQADLAAIPPELMRHLRLNGEIYALPQDSAQYGLFYNRDIFDQHNREHPNDPVTYPSADWTWEDLRETARNLARHDDSGRLTRAGFDFAIWAWPFLTLFHQAGGEAFSSDGLTCTLDSSAGVQTLEFLRAMQRDDKSFDPTLAAYTAGVGADTFFATGRTAMMLDGSWRVPNFDLTAPDLNYAVAPLPRGPREGGRPGVVSGGVLWAISAHAKRKDDAWDFLRWLVAEDQSALYWDTLRVAPPADLRVFHSPAFRQTRGVPIDPDDLSRGYDVPPMPAEDFDDKARWLLYGVTPHPETGQPPGFIISNLYLGELYDEIARMLTEFLKPDSQIAPETALRLAVQRVHAVIDRDRASRGLPTVER